MSDTRLTRAYREHERDLLRFLASRLGSTQAAADVAHDVYVKLLSGVGAEARDARAYMFAVAANLAADHLRGERRRSHILADAGAALWRETDPVTPERMALARAELAAIERAIATLPDRCRMVFFLSRFDGKSQQEVADELNIGVTTVYKDLRRALDVMMTARRRFRDNATDA